LPISAVDTITPAFQHTKHQLLKPFRFGQWVRLALLGLATGELGSSGSCRVPSVPQRQPSSSDHLGFAPPHLPPILSHLSVPELVLLASVAMLLLVVVMLLFLYLNSICRFILFDSILRRECTLRDGWRRWRPTGRRFFVWQLLFQIVVMMGLVIFVGLPLGFAYLAGWFRVPKQHLAPLILGGIFLFFVLAVFVLLTLLVHVLAKDFVVPLMALDQLDWSDAWERFLAMLKAEKGGYAGYIGMKVLLAIAAGIILGVIGFVIVLIFVLPVVLAFLIPTMRGGAGTMWNVYTITLAVVVGIVMFAFLMCLISLISVPVVVFFPAYSIYFFAARYPALSLRLYGPPPPLPPTPPLPSPVPL
jgi:preprotein translocase subunit Sss1